MGLGRDAFGQGQFHGGEHGLFVALQYQGEDVDHLAVTAGLAQHVILQLPEGRRQFQEGGAIPKGPGLALNDRQIMSPVVDHPRRQMVATLDHAGMFAQDTAFGRDNQPVWIDPQADGTVGE